MIGGSSPFASHFQTNYIPTDDEIAEINALLVEKSAVLSQIETELRRIQHMHEGLSREIEDHRALISPARRLPADVLREIFMHCLPTGHNAIMSKDEFPILLTRVCHRWRTIAFSTPRLWASIHIPVPCSAPLNPHTGTLFNQRYDTFALNTVVNCAKVTREWLDRSGACALDISFIDGNKTLFPGNGYCGRLIESTIGFSARWKTVNMQASAHDIQYLLSLLSNHDLPLLESLSLNFNRTTSDPSPRLAWSEGDTLNTPRLREVSFIGVGGDYSKFPIHWSQLTSLTVEGVTMSVAGMSLIMRYCPLLVSCRMDVSTKGRLGEEFPHSSTPISLPRLRDLSIREWDNDLSIFFTLLDAPSLGKVEYRRDNSWTTQNTLQSLLSRTTIHTFITDSRLLSRDNVIAYLRDCPHLTALSIRPSRSGNVAKQITYLDDHYLRLLSTPDQDGNFLCPALEVFECRTGAGFTDQALLDFIKRREAARPNIAKLKRVSVSFERPQITSIAEELRSITDTGVVVDFWYPVRRFKSTFSPFYGLDEFSPSSSGSVF
ncbi:hypothetical protein BDZ97DRAFT_1870859 [Flammula alnicola]|nr:hypothetical protein BDZ97DRAFT_1870859 [Flammula alnicola]